MKDSAIAHAEKLESGAFITIEEQDEIAAEIRRLHKDAMRYRWLNKYTAHLFMVTEQGLDKQMDHAMGKKDDTR